MGDQLGDVPGGLALAGGWFPGGGFGGKGGDIAQGATVNAVEVAKEAGDGVDHETPAVASKMVV